MTDATAAPRRRTQEERSSTTRASVTDATIRCLVSEGYANTTMAVVTDAAGMSRGAITHHFGTKSQLMIAAIEDMARRSETEMAEAAESLPDTPDRIGIVLSLLWDIFRSDLYFAILETWNAARTDDELHLVLHDVERELGRRHRQLLAEMFGPEIAEHPNFGIALDLTFNLMRGIGLTSIVRENPRREAELITEWTRLFEQLVTDTTTTSDT